jgi:hypothetical protein
MPEQTKTPILILGVAHAITPGRGKVLRETLQKLKAIIQPGQKIGIEQSARSFLKTRSWIRAVGDAGSRLTFKRREVAPTSWESVRRGYGFPAKKRPLGPVKK